MCSGLSKANPTLRGWLSAKPHGVALRGPAPDQAQATPAPWLGCGPSHWGSQPCNAVLIGAGGVHRFVSRRRFPRLGLQQGELLHTGGSSSVALGCSTGLGGCAAPKQLLLLAGEACIHTVHRAMAVRAIPQLAQRWLSCCWRALAELPGADAGREKKTAGTGSAQPVQQRPDGHNSRRQDQQSRRHWAAVREPPAPHIGGPKYISIR